MKTTKILWFAVPVVFLVAVGTALVGAGRKPQPEVKARIIVLKADPDDPEAIEQTQKEMEEIYQFLENGAAFAQVAETKSDAPSAGNQGDMGWVGKGVLPEHLENVLFSLEPGHYSEIIKEPTATAVIFRILYAEERRN